MLHTCILFSRRSVYSMQHIFNSDIYIKSSMINGFLDVAKFIYCLRDTGLALSQGRKRLHNKENTDERMEQMELKISKENILIGAQGLCTLQIRDWNRKHFESRTRNGVVGNKQVWAKYQRGALQPFQGYHQKYYFKKFNTYNICPILAESKPTKNFHNVIILQED